MLNFFHLQSCETNIIFQGHSGEFVRKTRKSWKAQELFCHVSALLLLQRVPHVLGTPMLVDVVWASNRVEGNANQIDALCAHRGLLKSETSVAEKEGKDAAADADELSEDVILICSSAQQSYKHIQWHERAETEHRMGTTVSSTH